MAQLRVERRLLRTHGSDTACATADVLGARVVGANVRQRFRRRYIRHVFQRTVRRCEGPVFQCQGQVHRNDGRELKYRNTLQSLALIWREEGTSAVYKGFRPNLAIRMGLGGATAMVVYEFIVGPFS